MNKQIIAAVLFLAAATHTGSAYADKVCLSSTLKNGKIKLTTKIVSTAKCPKNFTQIVNTNTLTGAPGADGSLKVYGDGSAGDFSLASGSQTFEGEDLQYKNFSVAAGATLTVPSGTVIRCTGTFSNAGTITVLQQNDSGAATQGFAKPDLSDHITTNIAAPLASPSGSSARNGAYGTNNVIQTGGWGGAGLTLEAAKTLFKPGVNGGGGGGLGGQTAGDGGGTLVVLCAGAVTNSGSITATGQTELSSPGGGGGGGGIIVVASMTGITNSGNIHANGGNGSIGTPIGAPGGGGGGGIVHFVAPTIPVAGTVTVAGGVAGNAVTVTVFPSSGGGGGGGCGGDGGDGGDVATDGTISNQEDGTAGYFIQTESDPTSLF